MSPLARFVEQLKKDGISFPGLRQPTSTASSTGALSVSLSSEYLITIHSPLPPNQGTSTVLQTREDEELRRAIQLSLQDSNPPAPSSSPLYPSIGGSSVPSTAPSAAKVVVYIL